jgi:hypothetical protein
MPSRTYGEQEQLTFLVEGKKSGNSPLSIFKPLSTRFWSKSFRRALNALFRVARKDSACGDKISAS